MKTMHAGRRSAPRLGDPLCAATSARTGPHRSRQQLEQAATVALTSRGSVH
jgi:hypothetical protein